jgi:hypothetical protein
MHKRRRVCGFRSLAARIFGRLGGTALFSRPERCDFERFDFEWSVGPLFSGQQFLSINVAGLDCFRQFHHGNQLPGRNKDFRLRRRPQIRREATSSRYRGQNTRLSMASMPTCPCGGRAMRRRLVRREPCIRNRRRREVDRSRLRTSARPFASSEDGENGHGHGDRCDRPPTEPRERRRHWLVGDTSTQPCGKMRRRFAGDQRFDTAIDECGHFTRVPVSLAAGVTCRSVGEKLAFVPGCEPAQCGVRHPVAVFLAMARLHRHAQNLQRPCISGRLRSPESWKSVVSSGARQSGSSSP